MTARSDVLFITDKTKLLKSALGHFRPKSPARVMSAFPPIATIQWTSGEVRFVPTTDLMHRSKHMAIQSPRLLGQVGWQVESGQALLPF
jgi:hypothetical protein